MRVFHLQGIARGGRGREEEWGRNSYPFFPSAILAGYPYEFRFFDPPLPLWSAFDHARLFSRSLSSSTKTYVSEEIRRGGWNRIESILPASPKTTTTTTTKRTTKTHWNTYASLLFLLVSILLDVIIKAVFTRSSLVLSSFFYPFTSFYYLSLHFSLYLSLVISLPFPLIYLFFSFLVSSFSISSSLSIPRRVSSNLLSRLFSPSSAPSSASVCRLFYLLASSWYTHPLNEKE